MLSRHITYAVLLLVALPAWGDPPRSDSIRFERQQFSVARVRGRILLDGVVAGSNVVAQGDPRIRLIEAFDGLRFDDDYAFRTWTRSLRSPRTYTYDNVIRQRPDGSEDRRPLVLLPAEERQAIVPLWRRWLAENAEQERVAQAARDAARLEAERYEAQQRIAAAQAEAAAAQQRSLAILSGEVALWEVRLEPSHLANANVFQPYSFSTGPAGTYSGFNTIGSFPGYQSGVSIIVTGRNSQVAADTALAQYPGYRVMGVRKVAGY